jgi:hypothetical protein
MSNVTAGSVQYGGIGPGRFSGAVRGLVVHDPEIDRPGFAVLPAVVGLVGRGHRSLLLVLVMVARVRAAATLGPLHRRFALGERLVHERIATHATRYAVRHGSISFDAIGLDHDRDAGAVGAVRNVPVAPGSLDPERLTAARAGGTLGRRRSAQDGLSGSAIGSTGAGSTFGAAHGA